MSRLKFAAVLEPAGPRGGSARISLPPGAGEVLRTKSRLPVKGSVNGYPFRSSIFPLGDGRFYMIVNAEIRRTAGVKAGDEVEVALERDEETRSMEIPPWSGTLPAERRKERNPNRRT